MSLQNVARSCAAAPKICSSKIAKALSPKNSNSLFSSALPCAFVWVADYYDDHEWWSWVGFGWSRWISWGHGWWKTLYCSTHFVVCIVRRLCGVMVYCEVQYALCAQCVVSIVRRHYGAVVGIVPESSGLSQTGFGLHSRDRGWHRGLISARATYMYRYIQIYVQIYVQIHKYTFTHMLCICYS